MVKTSGIISGRFCKKCNEWYKPISKRNMYCKECKTEIFKNANYRNIKPKIEMSKELNQFYNKYGIYN